jgi:hypothetical protein
MILPHGKIMQGKIGAAAKIRQLFSQVLTQLCIRAKTHRQVLVGRHGGCSRIQVSAAATRPQNLNGVVVDLGR